MDEIMQTCTYILLNVNRFDIQGPFLHNSHWVDHMLLPFAEYQCHNYRYNCSRVAMATMIVFHKLYSGKQRFVSYNLQILKENIYR